MVCFLILFPRCFGPLFLVLFRLLWLVRLFAASVGCPQVGCLSALDDVRVRLE